MLCQRWSELLEGKQILRWEKSGYETAENQHLLAGTRIWEDLPLHRSMYPDSEPAPLQIRSRQDTPLPGAKDILLTARENDVVTGISSEIQSDDIEWLVYDRRQTQERLPLPLAVENVIFSQCNDLKLLYREMLEHLERKLPAIGVDHLLAEMWKREEDYTSLLGNGIALPHTWSADVEQATVVVARPQTHVICPLTGRPIEIVFMLLSPVGNANEHLEHLSFIARLIGSQAQRKRIMQARNAEELFELIVMS
jgi:mannitol/fructose-specific phosphotransferase system IIA component (Ntr-type)